jgi:hypothetical protein
MRHALAWLQGLRRIMYRRIHAPEAGSRRQYHMFLVRPVAGSSTDPSAVRQSEKLS